jgi:hypothetical protein
VSGVRRIEAGQQALVLLRLLEAAARTHQKRFAQDASGVDHVLDTGMRGAERSAVRTRITNVIWSVKGNSLPQISQRIADRIKDRERRTRVWIGLNCA